MITALLGVTVGTHLAFVMFGHPSPRSRGAEIWATGLLGAVLAVCKVALEVGWT